LARGDREWPLNNVTHATPYGDSFWLRIGRLGFVWHGATESGP
jgi:hypothetical protein